MARSYGLTGKPVQMAYSNIDKQGGKMDVCKRWFRILPVIALITLTIPLAVDTPTAYGNGGDDQFSISEKTELKYPNLNQSQGEKRRDMG